MLQLNHVLYFIKHIILKVCDKITTIRSSEFLNTSLPIDLNILFKLNSHVHDYYKK